MKIQGSLASYELSDLLQWLAQGRKTGRLTVRHSDGREQSIWFQGGTIAMSASSDPDERLDRYLLRQGLIDAETAERALRLQGATQMLTGQILVTLGAISEEELARVMRLKTEESVCQLLTLAEGEFTFGGEALPESSMVPLRIDVANLLLRSMERLDAERRTGEGGEIEAAAAPDEASAAGDRPAAPAVEPAASKTVSAPPPPAVVPAAPVRHPRAPSASDNRGLALAQVMDPEAAGSSPSDESGAESTPGPVARAAPRGAWERLRPLTAAAGLAIVVSVAYLVLRDGEPARATDLEGAIRITATEAWQPPAEPAGAPPSAAPAEQKAGAASVDPEARLREDYESRLARLRQELVEARRTAAEQEQALRTAQLASDLGPETAPAGGRPAPPPGTLAAAATGFATAADDAAASVAGEAPPSRPATGSQLRPAAGPTPEAGPPAGSARTARSAETEAPAAAAVTAEPSPPQRALPPDQAPASPAESAFVPARIVRRANPAYPPAARRTGRAATVTLRVLVDATGRASEIEAGSEVGFGFDRAALTAARRTRWEPATLDGEPVESWVEMRFEFTH